MKNLQTPAAPADQPLPSVTGREATGLMLDIQRDPKGTFAALRNATSDQRRLRADVARHQDHRVEIRRADQTVAARGVLAFVTVSGLQLIRLEAGEKFVPLAQVDKVVRLSPRQDAGLHPVETAAHPLPHRDTDGTYTRPAPDADTAALAEKARDGLEQLDQQDETAR